MTAPRNFIVFSDAEDAARVGCDDFVPADRYLQGGHAFGAADHVLINLCRSYEYGSKGYYVSLLADARGQTVLPGNETGAALADAYARFRALQEAGVPTIDAAEMAVRRREHEQRRPVAAAGPRDGVALAFVAGEPERPLLRDGDLVREAECAEVEEIVVVFGGCADPRFQHSARGVFREFPAPLLRVQLVLEAGTWKVCHVAAAHVHELRDAEIALLKETLTDSRRLGRIARHCADEPETVRASIAVLVDDTDVFSPSSPETIDRLERVAARMNVHVARLALADLRKLPEYDALFVRSNTGVTHPAFQFALRAEALGMPVIDDPQSTIRCTNKVFMEELMSRAGVPTPRTHIVTAATSWDELRDLGEPLVLKLPDGAFSTAVHKVGDREEFERRSAEMLAQSPLILAQEWLPTEFDWRIGVLGGRLLFAARYFMARGHWQIRTVEKGTERYGKVEAVPRGLAPADVVKTALRAAALVGNGFYGVDIKETERGPVVIEVNDNPNLDTGYEDTVDGDHIYEDIVRHFLDRIRDTSDRKPHDTSPEMRRLRARIDAAGNDQPQSYPFFGVAGIELEYPIVDRDLNVRPLVEQAFRDLAGRGTSDVDMGAVAFSNEFADHVLEVKTPRPLQSWKEMESLLYEGVQRFGAVLRDNYDARLLPTGMHPWFDPRAARLWTRSNLRIYTTYARLFNVRTHGWMNVQASHINFPFGTERETIAMHTAAALLIPYLPALAASSPIHDRTVQPEVDARLKWLTTLQSRVPESTGQIVPEIVDSFSDYRRRILHPMYAALDRLENAQPIRHEFFNARGAILRFSRRAMEVRVLDVQECVKMDVAIAAFVRAALRTLTDRILKGRAVIPPHGVLVDDFRRCIERGSRALVAAPHLRTGRVTSPEQPATAADVLAELHSLWAESAQPEEAEYVELVRNVIARGSLAERILRALEPARDREPEAFQQAVRAVFVELADCLEENRPWAGRAG